MENKQNKDKNNKEFDIQSVIDSLSYPTPQENEINESERCTSETVKSTPDAGALWNEFIICLKSKGHTGSTKLYAIDGDIIETLRQCDFGASNVKVINSILRTFLIENINNLKCLPKLKVESILDKYDR